jgi:hypothetical protein
MANQKPTSIVLIIAIIAAIVVAAYMFMNAPDRRTPGEKVGDAIENAGESLQDRTPAEKLGDAAEDAGDSIERAVK